MRQARLCARSNALGCKIIDGFFIDDGWGAGPSEEDHNSVRDMGLSPDEVKKIDAGWAANMKAVKAAILKSGGL